MNLDVFVRHPRGLGFLSGGRGHGGARLAFAAGLFEKVLIAVACIALATIVAMLAEDWSTKRYGPKYAREIQLLTFMVVLIAMGLAAARTF